MEEHARIYKALINLALGKLYNEWKKGEGGPKGLTQQQLAEKLDMAQVTVSRYLISYRDNKEVRIGLMDLIRILRAYNVGVGEMAEAIGDYEVAHLCHQLLQDRDMTLKLADIMMAGGKAKEAIRAQVEAFHPFVTGAISKKKESNHKRVEDDD